MGRVYGVGLVGVTPPASWAVVAHLPALRARSDKFRIVGIANSTAESGAVAAKACGIARAFDSVDALCADPEVDIVVVTVRAYLHAPIVEKALAAGKHVFCEWPLGCNYAETRELAALAADAGVVAICGSQAGVHPTLRYAASLIAAGWIGEPLFVTVVADGGMWGAAVPQGAAYATQEANGATLLTISFGHTIVGLQEVFGPVATVFGESAIRRKETRVIETGKVIPLNAPDTVIAAITFESGLPMSVHYRAGINRSGGFRCEIIGADGILCLTGDPHGAIEMVDLDLQGAKNGEPTLVDLPVPDNFLPTPRQGIIPDNVMSLYDLLYDDLENGTHLAPTFDDAVKNHRILEAINRSSAEGKRIVVKDF